MVIEKTAKLNIPKVSLVCLTGKKGSGKSYFYQRLQTLSKKQDNITVIRIPFAGALKYIVSNTLGKPRKCLLKNILFMFTI